MILVVKIEVPDHVDWENLDPMEAADWYVAGTGDAILEAYWQVAP
jgi:hypothetical protein